MAENEDSNSKNGTIDFKKRRGIYVPVAPNTSPPLKVLFSFWRWIGVGDKTLWNWLELLIVPLFLAGGAFYLESQTEARQDQIATNRYQQEALAKYLDQMTALLLDENLRKSEPDSEARSIARARTITALQELDGDRKGLLIRFLHESSLISTRQTIVSLVYANLSNADLRNANLSNANLTAADLSNANLFIVALGNANLNNANLSSADLSTVELDSADLSSADLSNANLNQVDLNNANLNKVDLSNANLSTVDLSNADLSDANLSNANLFIVDLSSADLSNANLSNANLDTVDINKVSLCRTIMPDGKMENRNCPP